jgi:hypothetical protein
MQNSLDYNKFFTDLKISEQLKVEEDLGSGYVKLKISESERRQALQDIKCVEDIVVELLRNSRDAGSKNIFIATKKTEQKKRLIYCIDDGRGIPQKFHNLIFQSRVTSKLEDGARDSYGFHGRGMALFSIKLNVEDIRIIYSDLKKGTCMLVEVDLEKIPEKKDQSALPNIIKKNETYELSGGVNNIIRVVIEFALHNKDINFYYGSPSQITATLIDRYNRSPDNEAIKAGIKKVKRFEDFDLSILSRDIGITGFSYYADSYAVLEQILRKYYAMEISVRNVQRLAYGEIEPLKSVYESMTGGSNKDIDTSVHDGDARIKGKDTGREDSQKNSKDDIGSSSGLFDPGTDNRNNSSNTLPENRSFNIGSADVARDSGTLPDRSYIDHHWKNKDINKGIRLYDELKLANRFKDEEIRYIISILEKEIINIGSKYFITLDSNIEFKKVNNVITLTVNLKQKD